MPYSAQTLVYDVLERLKASGAQVPASITPRLITLVPSALRMLPVRVKERFGDTEAEIYRKDYLITLTDGAGSLATHTALTSEPMIPSEIAKVTHPDVVSDLNLEGKLRRVGSASALDYSRSLEFSYFAVENNTLFTMKDNLRTTLQNDATARAAFPPLIENVIFSHEPLLVEAMLEISQGVIAKAA